VLLERLTGVGFIILGADRQDNPPLLEPLDVMLKGNKSFPLGVALPQGNSAQTVVANYPAPQGVVQVQDQALLAFASNSQRQRVKAMGQRRQVFRRSGQLGVEVKTVVSPLPLAVDRGQAFDVVERYIGRGLVEHTLVEAA
jgi:hypothetical protein